MKRILLFMLCMYIMMSQCFAMTFTDVREVTDEDELKTVKECELYSEKVSCISRLYTDTNDKYYYFRIKKTRYNPMIKQNIDIIEKDEFFIIKHNIDGSFSKVISSADLESDKKYLGNMHYIDYNAPEFDGKDVSVNIYYSKQNGKKYYNEIKFSMEKDNNINVKLVKEHKETESKLTKMINSHFTVMLKPVIYLYPTQKTDVFVNLKLDGKLTCSYPAINDGWNVTAEPNGVLTDKNGRKYNYLFWEGKDYLENNFSTGFCVAGKDTQKFLEETLNKQGLSDQEADDFITYWLPKMENNPYNIISFQGKNFTDKAVLNIVPKPDTVIRIFMSWKPSNEKIEIPEQKLETIQRKGFTLVEWGGSFE